MIDVENVVSDLLTLRRDFSMVISDEFIDFIKNRKKFDYAGQIVNYGNYEAEFNNFLLSETNDIQDSILKWYILSNDERKEYLTFAFGGNNDEFAIKVSGDNLGGIYHIFNRTEDELQINFMFKNWKEFVKELQK